MQPTSKEDWSAKKSVASYDRNFGTAVRSKVRYADKQFNKLLRKKYSVVSEVLQAPLWAGDIPAFPRFICACKIRREKNLEKTPRSVVFVPGPFSSYQIWSRGEKPTCGSEHKDFALKNPGHLLQLFCAKKTRLWHFFAGKRGKSCCWWNVAILQHFGDFYSQHNNSDEILVKWCSTYSAFLQTCFLEPVC